MYVINPDMFLPWGGYLETCMYENKSYLSVSSIINEYSLRFGLVGSDTLLNLEFYS